jgi:4-carboxymuconolactone decarboxylase
MRLAVLSSDTMTPEQVGLYREILSGPRGQGPRAVLLATGAGGLAGPFNTMLYAPDVGHALQELGAAIRFRTQLTSRVREMAILVVAQAWDSAYERASHEPIGRAAGLTEPEIQALRAGADPGFADEPERVAWSVVRSLVGQADLDDREYELAVRTLGEQALVELSTLVGYYATLALQLRIFRVGAE